jgi:hypothetical protein
MKKMALFAAFTVGTLTVITCLAADVYNWRNDAERLDYIYTGKAYCEKYKKDDLECLNTLMNPLIFARL